MSSDDARREAYVRGQRAEAFVAEHLRDRGWAILAQNWRGGGAELDVVAHREHELRFVEVKARQEDDDSGLESIGSAKVRRLSHAAEAWLAENPLDVRGLCFVVALVSCGDARWTIEWIDDAFDGM